MEAKRNEFLFIAKTYFCKGWIKKLPKIAIGGQKSCLDYNYFWKNYPLIHVCFALFSLLYNASCMAQDGTVA